MRNSTGRPIRIRTPHDAVSAVPYLLGFHPSDSIVAVGFGGPHHTCAMRLDLPHTPPQAVELAGHLALLLARNKFRQAILLGYGGEGRVTVTIDATRRALTELGIETKEALRVADGRWWSYVCEDLRCCPADGVPYDITTSVVAAQATLAGQVAYPDRDELARTVAPLTGPSREAMRQATDRAEARYLDLLATLSEPHHFNALLTDVAVALLDSLRIPGAAPPSDDDVAWLGMLLTELRIRDEAWIRIDPDDPGSDIPFWRDILRRVEEPYAAAPACLLAYAAYLSGDGGLANVALTRATEAHPTYSMAHLLRELMLAGIPPSEIRLRMNPAQLAAAYNDHTSEAHPPKALEPKALEPKALEPKALEPKACAHKTCAHKTCAHKTCAQETAGPEPPAGESPRPEVPAKRTSALEHEGPEAVS